MKNMHPLSVPCRQGHLTHSTPDRHFLSPLASVLFAAGMLGAIQAHAIEIDTGNPEVAVRWDNTVRYNYGVRRQAQDPAILANANADDGNRNFNPDQVVANRLDVLSELDWVVDKKYGARMSAALWTDAAYNNLSSTGSSTYNSSTGSGTLSDYTSRYAKGPSGEILDAFVFSNFDAGDVPVSVRLGRHTNFWGEALALGGAVNGVSYGQYSIDVWKASATPGAESKELYRPRNGLTVQIQPATDLSVSVQTFFDWEAVRIPESGSYLGGSDMVLNGGDQMFVGTAKPRLVDNTPNKTGDWGLAARWSPEWLDGTLGFYARKTADIMPQLSLERTGAAVTGYHINYARNIEIFGTSLSKNIGGISVGAEISARRNMPLQSGASVLTASQWQSFTDQGETTAAKGETAHAVLNLVGVAPRTSLFDLASWSMELAWNRLLRVTSDPNNAYKGLPAYVTGGTNGINVYNYVDASTNEATTLALGFTPVWLSALPETDISLPITYSRGLNGNSAVNNGGNFDTGNWSIGLVADYKAKYNFALRYIGNFGRYSTLPSGAAQTFAGSSSSIADRGMLVFTFKATF